ncbi:hypothetical protein STEG23_013498, partial [Scotinomys teguina]
CYLSSRSPFNNNSEPKGFYIPDCFYSVFSGIVTGPGLKAKLVSFLVLNSKTDETEARSISLFPYGTSPHVGDQQWFARTVDFTSPLFKPQIGFPFGSSLRDSFYVSL